MNRAGQTGTYVPVQIYHRESQALWILQFITPSGVKLDTYLPLHPPYSLGKKFRHYITDYTLVALNIILAR